MSASTNRTKADWTSVFTTKLKTKTHEQFNLLLCDVAAANADNKVQIALLESLLFDSEGHTCPAKWCAYVQHTFNKFSDRKSQLQRLVNKALELLPEETNRDSRDYVLLHVASAKLKR